MHEDPADDDLLAIGLRALFHDTPPDATLRTAAPADFGPRSDAVTRIGRYEILGEIARGGVGVVLRGRDPEIGRTVAIKRLQPAHAANPALSRHLIEEGQIAGQLQHPGIVPVHELGLVAGESPYVAMKLVEGRTLAQILAERDSSRAELLSTFLAICQAVAYAHSRGVIHRDLKPHNVMIGAFGEVQVMDWGLAKVLADKRPEDAASLVQTPGAAQSMSGSVMGTPSYMSPEQARGAVEEIDERADVFGLGAILCEILTGEPPYHGASSRDVLALARQARLEPALARLDACGADPEVAALAKSCLGPTRDDRPRNAGAVAAEMQRYLTSLEERARRAALDAAEARARAQEERKARWLTVALAVAVLVTAAVAVGGYLWWTADQRERKAAAEVLVRTAVDEARSRSARAIAGGADAPAQWEAARDAARRALALATSGESDLVREVEELRGSIETGARRARFATRLEAIRQEAADPTSRELQDAAYREAFREVLDAGVDLESLEADEAAARLRLTGLSEEVAFALDDWALARRTLARGAPASWTKLIAVASLVDPDPWRLRLRRAATAEDAAELRALAFGFDAETEPASSAILLAQSLMRLPDLDSAEAVLRAALERHPGEYWIPYFLGHIELFDETDHPMPERFLSDIRMALAIRPTSPYPYALLAYYYYSRRERDPALRATERGLRIDPDNRWLLNSQGLILLEAGDLVGAERSFRRTFELTGHANPLGNLAIALFEQGRIAESRATLERALALSPGTGSLHDQLAQFLWEEGKPEEALSEFREAVRLEPGFTQHRINLGYSLVELKRFDEAITVLARATEISPGLRLAWDNLGYARFSLGLWEEALSAFHRAIRIDPRNGYAYEHSLATLEERAGGRSEEAGALVATLDDLLRKDTPRNDLAPALLVAAWCASPGTVDASRIVELAVMDSATRPDDVDAARRLARVLSLSGRGRQAVGTLETIARRMPTGVPPGLSSDLALYRRSLAPELVSFASIDAAVAAGSDTAGAREAATGDDAPLRNLYLEAKELQKASRHAEAIERLERVIAKAPREPEPYVSLFESRVAESGLERALAALRSALESGEGPRDTLPIPPLAPRPEGSTVAIAPFVHADPRVKHRATRWRIFRVIRVADADAEPAYDSVSATSLRALSLPDGFLDAITEYRWSAEFIGTDGRVSPPSEERTFRTGRSDLVAIPIDLSSVFDADVVADPDDAEDDPFDGAGHRLTVDGYDGERTDDAAVRGLPATGSLGVHRLGPYSGANAIRLVPDSAAVSIATPRARYATLRFLVAGSHGDSALPLTLRFADGSSASASLHCDDWFQDVESVFPPEVGESAVPIRNGMDRLRDGAGALDDCDDPALFEVVLPLDDSRELVAVDLEAARGQFESTSTRFHLFALTAMRRGE